MADSLKVTRAILESISDDPRWIKLMEGLVRFVPAETSSLSGKVEEAQFLAGLAAARAQLALDSIPTKKNDGAFLDTTDQAASAVNTPTAATFNTTTQSNNVSVSGSQVKVEKAGLYKIEFRVQL